MSTLAEAEEALKHEAEDVLEESTLLLPQSKPSNNSYTDASKVSFWEASRASLMTKQVGDIPVAGLFVLVVEFCERLAYYGATLVFTLYMLDMLEFSKETMNAVFNAFNFFAYFTPLLGGYIADTHLGKYRTILYFGVAYLCGLVVLTLSASPFAYEDYPSESGGFSHFSNFGFVIALFLVGLGTGGIKANVSTLMADQLKDCTDEVLERVFRYFYAAINAGAFIGQLVAPILHKFGEAKYDKNGKSIGTSFWMSFLMPTCMLAVGLCLFTFGKPFYIVKKPTESLLSRCYRAIRSALANKKAAKETHAENAEEAPKHWLDYAGPGYRHLAQDLKLALKASKVFLVFPVYWLLYNQMQSNFIAQANWMALPSWLTADQLNLVDALIIIMLIPVFNSFIFPFLRARGFKLRAITRMTIGFIISSLAFVYAGVLQYYIAKNSVLVDGDFVPIPDQELSVWLQVPPYILIAVSEIFASVSALEFAYAQAPESMKSIIMALFLLTNAGGALLGLIMSSLFKPENYTIIFFSFSGAMFSLGVIFYGFFHDLDKDRTAIGA
eukprot:Colp12_sorted_trinity150504_noHs@24973